MIIDAIVPAHNEEHTVCAVVAALVASRVFRRVIVVDDGSTDRTSFAAALGGAEVVRLTRNAGKGGAMVAGAQRSNADHLAFFDADALGLDSSHALMMAEHYALGFDQVCGIQDHGYMNPLYAASFPLLTGQRFMRRSLFELLPLSCGRYSVEAAINYMADANDLRTCVVFLRGVTFRTKARKVGVVRGFWRDAMMVLEARRAAANMSRSGGVSCDMERP